MKTIKHRNHSRPAFARFGKTISAAAFGLLIGAFAIGSVHADNDHHGKHGGGHDRGHEERHEYRGRGYYAGPNYAYGNRYYRDYPDYYYAPEPNYYNEPDPYDYGYYPPEQGYYGPSEGIRQFFGL
jgi:hypothetical protein